MNRSGLRYAGFAAVLVLSLAATSPEVQAAEAVKTYTKQGKFEDVKADLRDAVINRGLVIEFSGDINGMLERTGEAVGSTRQVYKGAEFIIFCSAKLSRAMMEADPMNIGFCPYTMFVYEAAAKPGEIVVGYRRPSGGGSAASDKALADVDALLDGIAKSAIE